MSYTVVVEIKVVNTEGEIVDTKGWPHLNSERKFLALKTEQRFVTFEDVEKAQATLNTLHGVIKQLKDL